MEPKYRYSESTVEPVAVEVTADGTVYLRKDIVPEIRKDASGDKVAYWTYQEAMMTAEEFAQYSRRLIPLNAVKDADNAANIKLLVAGQENGDFNQMAIMEAIAEIYEMVSSLGR